MIAGVRSVPYWTLIQGNGPFPRPRHLQAYDLHWTQLGTGEATPLCGRSADGSVSDDFADTLGMSPELAVVFEGDRFDAVHKTIDPVIDRDWFNIGCAGQVLAKLALAGHTEAAIADGYDTSWSDRQALLKMLVGDYCGNGTAFTVPGQPLYWRDQWRVMRFLSGDVSTPVEARWSSQGAICLGQPRLDANPPGAWPERMSRPAIGAVHDACPELPACSDGDPQHQDGAYLVSANPIVVDTL